MTVAEPDAVDTGPQVKRLGMFNQLFRFVGIGGVCAVIDASFYALFLGMGLPNFVSRSGSFIIGTSTSYLVNRKYTFSGASTGNTKLKALGFALVYMVTFFVNTGTNQLLYLTLPDFDFASGDVIRYATCWVIGQGLGTLINFGMLKWIVFRD